MPAIEKIPVPVLKGLAKRIQDEILEGKQRAKIAMLLKCLPETKYYKYN